MKNIILTLLLLFTLISCNNNTNKIEVTFLKTDLSDSHPIELSFLRLSNKDSIIYNKKTIERISVGKKIIFDSLPNGEYILEYSNIELQNIVKHIKLQNNQIYRSKIIYDSLPLNNYYKKIPINNLKNGESYKLFTWGGCVARMESFYQISNKNNEYFFESNAVKNKLLKDEDLKAIEKFEAELYALRGKGGCHSTGKMTYSFTKNNKTDTINEFACNWNTYRILMRKLH
jgi:hypothetical protein